MADRPDRTESPFWSDEYGDRTIGHSAAGRESWTWRGQGYDEGWDTPSRADLTAVRDFITRWLETHEGEP